MLISIFLSTLQIGYFIFVSLELDDFRTFLKLIKSDFLLCVKGILIWK